MVGAPLRHPVRSATRSGALQAGVPDTMRVFSWRSATQPPHRSAMGAAQALTSGKLHHGGRVRCRRERTSMRACTWRRGHALIAPRELGPELTANSALFFVQRFGC